MERLEAETGMVAAIPDIFSADQDRAVHSQWEHFVRGKDPGQVRRPILDSWLRCQAENLDPGHLPPLPSYGESELGAILTESPMLSQGALVIERAIQACQLPPQALIVIADDRLRALHLTGDRQTVETARGMNVLPGASMAERQMGTNVIALAHRLGEVAYTYRGEHYFSVLHGWQSCAAPVRSSLESQEIIGFVSLCSLTMFDWSAAFSTLAHLSGLLSLLAETEQKRAACLLFTEYQQRQLQLPHEAIVAVDGMGKARAFSSAFASLIPSLAPESIRGRSLWECGFAIPEVCREARPHPPEPEILELDVPCTGTGVVYRAVAVPVRDAGRMRPAGHILTFRLPGKGGSRSIASSARAAAPSGERNASSQSVNRGRGSAARYTFDDLLGKSPAFVRAVELAHIAASNDDSVLLLGESGTGKELFAQAIHNASCRRAGPFVALNCGSASEELIATELFGYAPGTFTGGLREGKRGKIELAHNGTLFLDEVGEMPPRMQQGLLRAIEQREVVPLGGDHPRPVDVRIVSATNANLLDRIREGRFRLDLFHRINIFPIDLPPLRQRIDDLDILFRHFLKFLGCPYEVTREALQVLSSYAWPGNLRELGNMARRLVRLNPSGVITARDLPSEVRSHAAQSHNRLKALWKEIEEKSVLEVLDRHGGNVFRASQALGVSRVTLYRKLKEFKIPTGGPRPRRRAGPVAENKTVGG